MASARPTPRPRQRTAAPARTRSASAPSRAARPAPPRPASPRRSLRHKRFPWVALVVVLALLSACGTLLFRSCSSGDLERKLVYPVHHEQLIAESCARHGVDPHLACAVIKCESDWQVDAVSSAGARGLMQLMDYASADMIDLGVVSTAYDPDNLFDPATNIEFGCGLLGYLQDNLANEDEVIAAYNAGIGSLYRWRETLGADPEKQLEEVIDYPETVAYLQRVREAKQAYQRLYPLGI